jgi:hypothetical protein
MFYTGSICDPFLAFNPARLFPVKIVIGADGIP